MEAGELEVRRHEGVGQIGHDVIDLALEDVLITEVEEEEPVMTINNLLRII